MTDTLELAVDDIRQHARATLDRAGVDEHLPVPIDVVASAVDLRRGDLYEFEDEVPPEMRKILAKIQGNVLGVLSTDERRYYVDPTLPLERRRFTEAHEIGHDALPWHAGAYFAEDYTTLRSSTRDLLEAEANQFAAEVLFAGDRFSEQADAMQPSIEVPLSLNALYQTSAAATLRRYVANSRHPLALIATGLKQSRYGNLPVFSALSCESPSFSGRYGMVRSLVGEWIGSARYPELHAFSTAHRGTVAATILTLDTARGNVRFVAEGFVNGRNGFVLLRE